MSLLENIDHLAQFSGVEAVLVQGGEGTEPRSEFRGESAWRERLEVAFDVFSLTDEKRVRLLLGKHTVVLQRERKEVVAAVHATGHPTAKSLRRAVFRMSKRVRSPGPGVFGGTKPSLSGTWVW